MSGLALPGRADPDIDQPRRKTVVRKSGVSPATRVTVEDDWVVVRAPVAGRHPWVGLQQATDFPRGCKLLIEARRFLVGGESPLPMNGAAACRVVRGVTETAAATRPRSADVARPVDPAIVEQALSRAGHPTVRREDDGWVIKLSTPGGYYPTVVRPAGDGWLVRAELVSVRQLTDHSRRAIGWLLLVAAGDLRAIRAIALRRGDEDVACFEIPLAVDAPSSETAMVLRAVAMASDLFGREARTLAVDTTAQQYLAHCNLNTGD